MKRLFTVVIGLSLAASAAFAQKAEGCSGADRAIPVELRAYGEYGYSQSTTQYGGLALGAGFSFTDYFDFQVGLKARTSNVYAADVRGVVYFPLSKGSLTLEPRFVYEASVRSMTHHFNIALSLGYRMDHFRVQLGWSSRAFRSMVKSENPSDLIYITDPFNLYYSIEGYLRKDSDCWNVGLKLANYDDFIIEQDTHPIVKLIGLYRPTERLGVFAEVYYRASGVAHVANNFYEAGIRFGVNYQLNL